MAEEKSSDFKFRIDEESPDSVFRDDIRELRLEKLSKRVTILSILIPCLIGGLIAFAYIDIKKRVLINQDSGAKTVQNLSKDFDTRLYNLMTKTNDLENTLATRAATLEKNFSSLKFRLYKNENKIKKLTASKAEKKDQEAALKEIKNISSQIDALDSMVQQKLADLTASTKTMNADLIKIRAEISTLVTSKIDREFFDQELQKEQQFQQNRLDTIKADLAGQIQAIRKEIDDLEKRVVSIQQARQQTPLKPTPSSPPKSSAGSTESRPANADKPKAGQIIEKDI
jgi:DNA repair exonuclease SbcCD ATPase subunit